MAGVRWLARKADESERGVRKEKDVGNPWVELLVSIYGLLHNRSRPVSRNGKISAAKMGRWRGKTWLEFAPRRGRATASSGTARYLGLSWALKTHHIWQIQKGSVALIVVHQSSFNFSYRDCVTVFRFIIPPYLALPRRRRLQVSGGMRDCPSRFSFSPPKSRRRESALGQLINTPPLSPPV